MYAVMGFAEPLRISTDTTEPVSGGLALSTLTAATWRTFSTKGSCLKTHGESDMSKSEGRPTARGFKSCDPDEHTATAQIMISHTTRIHSPPHRRIPDGGVQLHPSYDSCRIPGKARIFQKLCALTQPYRKDTESP